jgi:hypothetical protein
VVIVVPAIVIVMIVVVVAMVLAVPVAFVHLPALLVVVVVRMAPVGAGVRWPLPNAWDPDIMIAANSPVAIDPSVAFSGQGRPDFIPDGWRRGADIDLDLAECRDCQS